MKTTLLKLATVLIALALALSCTVTAFAEAPVVRIGSKDFTESLIVAEIYALALEDAGLKVERKFGIAGSLIHAAILSQEIDIYPEYTGTGLLAWLEMDEKVMHQDVPKAARFDQENRLVFELRVKFYPEDVSEEIVQDVTLVSPPLFLLLRL